MKKVPASFSVKKDYKDLNLNKDEYYWRDHDNVYLQVFETENGMKYPGFFFSTKRVSKTIEISDSDLLSLRKKKIITIPVFQEESEINENSFLLEKNCISDKV